MLLHRNVVVAPTYQGSDLVRSDLQDLYPSKRNTGHHRAPGFSSLSAGGTISSNNTYLYKDFEGTTFLENISNVTFIGCRFQSNEVGFANIYLDNCDNMTFLWCSIVPLVSLHTTTTHPHVWPSAGAGVAVDGGTGFDAYMIPGTDGYQYGVRMIDGSDNILISHCDIWGFGNAVDMPGASNVTVEHCWIHDAANPNPEEYHTDGPGYLDGFTPPPDVIVHHCTVASLGNTNAIAFQVTTSAYDGIHVTDNFLSGFNHTTDMCHNSSGNTNMTYTGNIHSTHIRWIHGPLYDNYTSQFNQAANVWHSNKIHVAPGTTQSGDSTLNFSPADNGKFLLPNGTLSFDDFEAP